MEGYEVHLSVVLSIGQRPRVFLSEPFQSRSALLIVWRGSKILTILFSCLPKASHLLSYNCKHSQWTTRAR